MFHNHAITTFNEYFKIFDFDEYFLSYYIYPGYRGTGIKAAQYQRIQSATVSQIGKFYLQAISYNTPYVSQINTPLSRKCKYSSKTRTYLSVENLKAMSKIHSYYIANNKSELPNYNRDQTAEEICAILNNTHLYDDDEYDNEYNEAEMAEIIPTQNLEILNILVWIQCLVNEQLELNKLDDFIQELDKKEDF
ncbi:hypothetical protein C1645_838487 [Glomus cerebriforme]|uniref:Uncharacterized protein n=1 Tax=Glomus cerebriforme TaxID=658196 RepID=A0A397S3K7_9GLOM|nr:hypothetical protein C1645_838487 [Glomus cerebriforme]